MSNLNALRQTVATLRAPGGCPWDREQTHQTLSQALIDECSELLETIDNGDYEHMREELGDVLLQVVMHAQIAEEADQFDLEAVAADINAKLVRRHPHVFGDAATKARLDTSDKVLVEWEAIKAAEKKARPNPPEGQLFKDLPPRLPALLFAYEVYKQIDRKGIPTGELLDDAALSESQGTLTEAELGEFLFQWVAAARKAKLDPEAALRRYTQRLMKELSGQIGGRESEVKA